MDLLLQRVSSFCRAYPSEWFICELTAESADQPVGLLSTTERCLQAGSRPKFVLEVCESGHCLTSTVESVAHRCDHFRCQSAPTDSGDEVDGSDVKGVDNRSSQG